MVLQCPWCRSSAQYPRSHVFGQWVVCPACERPFAWRRVCAEPTPAPRLEGRTMSNGGNEQ